jgi:hypothetical protein
MSRAIGVGAIFFALVACGQGSSPPAASGDAVAATEEATPTSEPAAASPTAPTKTVDAAPAPPPAPTGLPAPEPGGVGACETTDDCVLIRGVCGQWQGVDRAHEAEESERVRERAKHVRCAKRPIQPASPLCVEGRCLAKHHEWPLLRSCRTAEDCVVIEGLCSSWDAVSKTSRDEAVERYRKQAAALRCAETNRGPRPTPVCRGGHCVPR